MPASAAGRPSEITDTPAKAAPPLTPIRPGSASGLRNSPCIIAPETARTAPTMAPSSVRGSRMASDDGGVARGHRVEAAEPEMVADDRQHMADRDVRRPDADAGEHRSGQQQRQPGQGQRQAPGLPPFGRGPRSALPAAKTVTNPRSRRGRAGRAGSSRDAARPRGRATACGVRGPKPSRYRESIEMIRPALAAGVWAKTGSAAIFSMPPFGSTAWLAITTTSGAAAATASGDSGL